KFKGERNCKPLDRCIRSLIRTGAAMALIFVCIYFFAGNGIMNILTSDRNVTETAREYFGWALTVPVAGFMAFTWDGIFGGLTQTRIGLLVPMALATLLFFGVYAVSVPLWGNHGLWAAFVVYCATRGIAQTLYYRIYKRRHYQ
ncbi:MAG: MATE family efflux transporter, partial [Muribaculaceae bacterium]|nr:MATE family efflux transporter [Muribaculaceae bacterium]